MPLWSNIKYISKYTYFCCFSQCHTHFIRCPSTYCRRDVILFNNSCGKIPLVKIRGPTNNPPTVETTLLECPQRPSTTSIQSTFARVHLSTTIKPNFTMKKNESVLYFFIMNSKNAPLYKMNSSFTIPVLHFVNNKCLKWILYSS